MSEFGMIEIVGNCVILRNTDGSIAAEIMTETPDQLAEQIQSWSMEIAQFAARQALNDDRIVVLLRDAKTAGSN